MGENVVRVSRKKKHKKEGDDEQMFHANVGKMCEKRLINLGLSGINFFRNDDITLQPKNNKKRE